MNMLIFGILINTILFGMMTSTDPKMGVSILIPRMLKNKFVDIALVILYFLSFFIILFSGYNLIISILICLGMQFFVNHIIWGIITGYIAGFIAKSVNKSYILNELQTSLANIPLPQDATEIISWSEKREIQEIPKWEVPVVINYNSKYKAEEQPKSALKPLYTLKLSDPERLFIEALNKSNNVKWWYKNGETEVKYFGILRNDNQAFYPDFIIQFKDGKIGIFETKKDRTAEDAKERAEALYKYIKSENKKGKKLWGGIAIEKNGSWKLNDNKEYEYNPNDLSDWKVLAL